LLSLSSGVLVLQAPLGDSVAFDPFPLFNDRLYPSEVDIGGRQALNAFVIALVIVMIDEGIDPCVSACNEGSDP
jgi:hypothetical protein